MQFRQTDIRKAFLGQEKKTCVLAIDVGICNVGVAAVCKTGSNTPHIAHFRRIDLRKFSGCNGHGCDLGHSATMADWVAHLVQRDDDFSKWAARANVILIERQPPCGLRDCEQLLFAAYRRKAVLIYPRSVHKHFKMGLMNYEQRKLRAVQILLSRQPHLTLPLDRAHDIADAALMAFFYIETNAVLRSKHRYPNSAYVMAKLSYMESKRYTRHSKQSKVNLQPSETP